ncbi:acylphosphatase [Rhodovulum visakhapatnamense]|uniref:acylphosphatase n=1 Tax=Rhodovulum visakhapatnamense TaxID=364297 RepID=A0A4R8FPP1_9RHOB|nr:acylphosphatase [Rhodovulum visakhapatnamense]TDX28293.1 acylphosphatase [Rhodovulum visakhapatnamense]
MTELTSIRLRVTGHVQGVGFRDWTQAPAENLGLSGRGRNAADGSVEAWVSGSAGAVADLVEALGHGPAAARVASVETGPADAASAAAAGPGFRILRRAVYALYGLCVAS